MVWPQVYGGQGVEYGGEKEKDPIGSGVWTLDLQLVELFGKG